MTDFLAVFLGKNWTDSLFKVQIVIVNIMAVILVITIACTYAKNEGYEPLSAGVMAYLVFLITTPKWILSIPGHANTAKAAKIISIGWKHGNGMVSAIIIGLAVGAVYSCFMKKDVKVKMSQCIPKGVVNAFSVIISAAVIFIAADFIYIFFKVVGDTTMIQWEKKIIQESLYGLSDLPLGILAIISVIFFLWFFRLHGLVIVYSTIKEILISNNLDNAVLQAAGTLNLEHGAHIVNLQFVRNYINMMVFSGIIGLGLYIIFIAKFAQYKQLGRLSLGSGLLNINEPMLFGSPIVIKPIIGISFALVAIINGCLFYCLIALGILQPMEGLMSFWTTLPIISGYLMGGVNYSIMQGVMIIITSIVYFLLLKKFGKIHMLRD